MLSEFCPDICPRADIAVALQCLRMGKVDVITYKYVIIDIYMKYNWYKYFFTDRMNFVISNCDDGKHYIMLIHDNKIRTYVFSDGMDPISSSI